MRGCRNSGASTPIVGAGILRVLGDLEEVEDVEFGLTRPETLAMNSFRFGSSVNELVEVVVQLVATDMVEGFLLAAVGMDLPGEEVVDPEAVATFGARHLGVARLGKDLVVGDDRSVGLPRSPR